MPNPIRHIAGPYEDGVQQCTRCLKIILDDRKATIATGLKRVLEGFPEGPMCISYGVGYVDIMCSTKSTDCQPMEAGL